MQLSVASVAALKIKHLRNKIEITKKWKALFIHPRYQTDLQPYTTNVYRCDGEFANLTREKKINDLPLKAAYLFIISWKSYQTTHRIWRAPDFQTVSVSTYHTTSYRLLACLLAASNRSRPSISTR